MTDYTTQIAALRSAAASGELTIEANGERVTYRSTADILQALRYFEGLQTVSAGTSTRSRSSLAVFGGGNW